MHTCYSPTTTQPNLWKADAILVLLKYCWVILLYWSQNLWAPDFIYPLVSLTILSLISPSMKVRSSSRVFCWEQWSFGKVDIIIWLSPSFVRHSFMASLVNLVTGSSKKLFFIAIVSSNLCAISLLVYFTTASSDFWWIEE